MLDLLTLTGLEIILGVDNVIFIALLVQNLPKQNRQKVMFLGLGIAFLFRILMLFTASWIISLTKPLFFIFNIQISAKSILLLLGGLFLIFKALSELKSCFKPHIHNNAQQLSAKTNSYLQIILQIIFIDFILSFDSIITAVGITNNLGIIIISVIISILIMMFSSKKVNDLLESYPQIKVIALYFIALVGVFIFLNGLQIDIEKGYLYFAIFFSIIVEVTKIKLQKITKK